LCVYRIVAMKRVLLFLFAYSFLQECAY
jgi:hypothetical protein